eukprot:3070146-Prymnesium_polylepis.1
MTLSRFRFSQRRSGVARRGKLTVSRGFELSPRRPLFAKTGRCMVSCNGPFHVPAQSLGNRAATYTRSMLRMVRTDVQLYR